ncbi:DMT family transporter [Paralimibaculum aggregatum]|uniref:DMT family transporter n=1 Tax=Paralimibaculum aggregatum TaxID=3036245 RepID=A0ABQ6LM29_9RHOB|nr:EamA family transporter [Limibaculum sp. NKW23]GMG84255.1 DMT family transporter [Limibaculum sp. NKW23]
MTADTTPTAPKPILGMGLMIGAMLIAPGLDVIAKLLMERLTPAETGAGRFLAQSIVMLPIILFAGGLKRPRPGHAAAGMFFGLTILAINLALREMPVANTIAIFFVEPLILTLLAALILGERLGWRRLAAVAVGLIGALVVLRPNLAAFGWAAVYPLAAALCFASYMLVTRAMSRTGGPLTLQFWTGVFAMLTLGAGMAVGALAAPEAAPVLLPNGRELALFLLIGVFAALVHQMITRALMHIEAGVAAPLQYIEIVSATLLGLAVFGDFPDALTWAGTAIIIAAGIYVFHRERRLARIAAAAPPP